MDSAKIGEARASVISEPEMSDIATKPMLRWTAIVLLFAFGSALMLCSVFVRAYFRAIDVQVVMEAGRATSSLVDEGIRSLSAGRMSQARLFQVAAQHCGVTGAQDLERNLQEAARWQAGQAGGLGRVRPDPGRRRPTGRRCVAKQ